MPSERITINRQNVYFERIIVMKRLIGAFFLIIFITLILPLAVVYIMGGFADGRSARGELIEVYFHGKDEVISINSEDYLIGVVAAEMNAGFEEEALKAQAVAARTYLYNHLNSSEADEYHKGAKICTDYTHCQAWTDINEKMEAWGDDAKKYREKIEHAVNSTAGKTVRYNGEIISAVFHSTSSGMTENARDVWGEDIPYLVSVESPGEEESPKYLSEVNISEEEYKNKIAENVDGTDFSRRLFSDIERSEAGGIINICVGGIKIRGTRFRTIFELNSTNINLTSEQGTVKMQVKGYGHGVGMSQFGANAMAKQGKNYKEILEHYYRGTKVE